MSCVLVGYGNRDYWGILFVVYTVVGSESKGG